MKDPTSVLTKGHPYPLGDLLPFDECERLGVPRREKGGHMQQNLRAIWDEQPPRRPKKGEWYLSGSPIDAYRAQNDLLTPFHIARLVRVDKVTTYKITELSEVKE